MRTLGVSSLKIRSAGSAAPPRCPQRNESVETLSIDANGRAREARTSGLVARNAEHFERRSPKATGLDLPGAVCDERDAAAASGDACRLEVVRADHHIHVRVRAVDAAPGVVRLVILARVGEAGAERDVRCCVLVQQRVVVDAPCLADARA